MIRTVLFDEDGHTWYAFSRDPHRSPAVIDTNEYLVVSDGEGVAMDPGGTEIFPQVVSALAQVIPIENIKHFLASHQDPDVMSALPLWMGLTPKARVYMSWLWSGFIAHYGHEFVDRFVTIADQGDVIRLGNGHLLQLVPAHYCHSSGNFSLYDPVARILFSGDIGAALLPEEHDSVYVRDVDSHIQYMAGFHRRWMPSNQAKNEWVERVRKLDVQLLCPQHGAIFKGTQVGEFLDWLEALEVGVCN
ncbi:MAG: MBL fold metallo-hydrolase [Gammaproteobacteria bacterium]|nr:MBL fold metallo-hydrolase [Gammaproteobacteria bacterium]